MTLLYWLNKPARKLGWQTILNLGLLLIALTSTAWNLAASARGLDTGLAVTTVITALGLGWALGVAKPLPGWLSLPCLVILGLEAISIRIGRLEAALVAVGQSLGIFVWQALKTPLTGMPAFEPITASLEQLWTRLNTLLDRVLAWALSLTTSAPAFDPAAAALVWALALWLVASWAGWTVRRWGRPLLGLTPAGLLLATTLAYRPQDAIALTPLLASILLLMGFTKHQARERSWHERRIDYSSDLLVDLSAAVIPITVLIVILAIVTPSVSVRQIREFFTGPADLTEPLARSLGVDPQPRNQASALQTFRTPGLPRRHLLGSGPELSRQVALIIKVELPQTGSVGESAVNLSPPPPQDYYWRSLTYDLYSGRGWSTHPTRLLSYDPGQQALATLPPHRQLLRQTVQTISDQSNRLYAAGDIVTANHRFEIEWRGPADAFGAIIEAKTYQVDSLITTATVDQLRAANSDHPDWLRRRYLSLPSTVPERVLLLARDLTAVAPTPYDRAKAIEAYLRQFPYSLDLPEPPSERDLVDYFLFELQRGYCDYYATAMVVLARAAGLPARLAVGYVGGRYNPASQQHLVSEAEAHSWPELYFPGYGWIGFEPTAAQAVERPGSNSETDLGVAPVTFPTTESQTPWQLPTWFAGVIAILALAGVGFTGWLLTETWRLQQLSPTEAVTVLYARLERHGARLATPIDQASTPFEFTSALSRHVRQIARDQPWNDRLQPLTHEVNWLTALYVRAIYSPRAPSGAEQTQAIQVWQRLRWRLWLARLSGYWSKLRPWICC